jgi:cytidylyltransferase
MTAIGEGPLESPLVLSDPMFQTFANTHPGRELVRYGYYDDGVTSPDWGHTITPVPVGAVRACGASEWPAVLVMTGAMDPMHEGHAEALEIARRRLEGLGFQIVNTHVVPDSHVYARMKRPMGAGSDEERAASVRSLGYVCDEDCMRYPGRPNYTSTLLHIQHKWQQHGVSPVVFNVVGSDNALFAEVVAAYDPAGFGTVVVETGHQEEFPVREDADRNILVCGRGGRKYASLSSTTVRSGNHSSDLPVMYIKDDLDYYTTNRKFHDELIDALEGMYTSYGYQVGVGHYRTQVEELVKRTASKYSQEIENGAITVSLDRHIPAQVRFPIHRLFQSDTLQKMGYLPDRHLQVHSGQKFILLDDDMDTGNGMRFVKHIISAQGGETIGVETIYQDPGREFDVLDASDVTTIGSTGLMIQSPDLTRSRIPYLHPFLDLQRFSSVPDSQKEEFTRQVTSILKKHEIGAYER